MNGGHTTANSTARHLRQADRRAGVDTLVRLVATDVLRATERRNLSIYLTQRLAQLARVRSIRLNEISGALSLRLRRNSKGVRCAAWLRRRRGCGGC